MLVINCALILALMQSGTASRCVDHACSPPMSNLASGRTLTTLSGCCGNGSHHSTCPTPLHPCPVDLHPPAHMVDDPFLHPATWWASGVGTDQEEEVRLDLETRFCLTHVVLQFHSPRPAAMAMERSQDFGQTWETLKLFAQNCSLAFGLPDDTGQPGSLCTSRYSSAKPCSRGEVIFRILGPGGLVDPYSPEGLSQLTLTNLRLRLLKAQTCPLSVAPSTSSSSIGLSNPPADLNLPPLTSPQPSTEPPASAPFSIYTLLARGTCLCHGHSEHCLHSGEQDKLKDMVPGRCVCTHHTVGEHCERCALLYNDRPWRAANGSSGEPHPCHKCECHGHAQSCHFSQREWLSSGATSGGVCDECQHNTAGRRCQRCRHGYHRHPAMPLGSSHICTRCWCDPLGSLPASSGEEGPWCHPRSGQCHCRPGVGGTGCSHCLPGYWGFGEEGCKPCACPQNCDPHTGICLDSSYANNQVFNVPMGGKIPDMDHALTNEGEAVWSKELAVSAMHYTGKCSCKERKLRSVSDLCKTKHAYVIKASVLSAHDKGSHAEVQVKVRKVLRSGQVPLSQGTHSLYPISWTSRGCTCPILNPGVEYMLAGPEEAGTGRLLVTMQSVVVPWTPQLGAHISEGLRQGCP
ncbi:netrin-4 isoform X1 [Coregonus clupeaformis]|uniref:netrin-4 isoform X1 n=1 Tax=Coregonus clupeaformis TaxID=59861 RepID=UPI001E1C3F6B|nr:netrin-4 isoform X1 [Coregonus clupeaformis]